MSERTTYRERRVAKAERYREWAEKREIKAQNASQAAHEISDMIPFGQPILVGHHSEGRHRRDLERIDRNIGASVENSHKADEFRSRADEIERQADNAIYSDDHDAVERLAEKIAGLEAERETIKRYNADCRKAAKTGGVGDTSILTAGQRTGLGNVAKYCPYQLGKGNAMPSYELTNLGGNISRLRKRLAHLETQKAAEASGQRIGGRRMLAKYAGTCADCGQSVSKGDTMTYYRATREVICEACDS